MAERAPELLSLINVSLSKRSKGLKDARMCRRETEGTTTKRKHKGSVDREAAVQKHQDLQAYKVHSSLHMGSVF